MRELNSDMLAEITKRLSEAIQREKSIKKERKRSMFTALFMELHSKGTAIQHPTASYR
jgi:hypothetical protein